MEAQFRKWPDQIGLWPNLWWTPMDYKQFITFQEWRALLLSTGPGRNKELSLLTSHIQGISKHCGCCLHYFVPQFLVFLPRAVLPWSESPSFLTYPPFLTTSPPYSSRSQLSITKRVTTLPKALSGLLVILEYNPTLPWLVCRVACLLTSCFYLSPFRSPASLYSSHACLLVC